MNAPSIMVHPLQQFSRQRALFLALIQDLTAASRQRVFALLSPLAVENDKLSG
jgi:hypothetical protein